MLKTLVYMMQSPFFQKVSPEASKCKCRKGDAVVQQLLAITTTLTVDLFLSILYAGPIYTH